MTQSEETHWRRVMGEQESDLVQAAAHFGLKLEGGELYVSKRLKQFVTNCTRFEKKFGKSYYA